MVGVPSDIVRHFIRTRGAWNGLQQWGKRAYLRKTTTHDGLNIFESDWDVLVILDACRPDLVQSVADTYPWLSDIETRPSVGTATKHWMEQTFSEVDNDTLNNTIYVCGNPFSGHVLDPNLFQHLEEVWRWGWSDQDGTVLPRPITDAAISLAREYSPKRLLIHYMQPHTPFIKSEGSPSLTLENFTGNGSRPVDDWELVEMGKRSEEAVWHDYQANLRTVLDDVALLRQNVAAERFVITSDHGNAVGERGLFGHPAGVSIPALYHVPWVEISATDTGEHPPTEYNPGTATGDIEAKLTALGYR